MFLEMKFSFLDAAGILCRQSGGMHGCPKQSSMILLSLRSGPVDPGFKFGTCFQQIVKG